MQLIDLVNVSSQIAGTRSPLKKRAFLSDCLRSARADEMELIVEIAVNEIQASPQYPAAMALRFARVKRFRNDKTADEADTIDTVRELFAAQA